MTMTGDKPEGGSGKCFLTGCIVLVIVGLIVVGLLYGAYLWAVNTIRSYTAEAPIDLPALDVSYEDYEAAEERVAEFEQSLAAAAREGAGENGELPEARLALSERDLNAMIAFDPEWSFAKDRVHIALQGSELNARVSIPLDFVWFLKGRFLNGDLRMKPVIEDGELTPGLVSLVANDKEVEEQVLAQVEQFIVVDILKDPDMAEITDMIGRVSELRIAEGELLLRMKPDPDAPVENPEEPHAEGVDEESATGVDIVPAREEPEDSMEPEPEAEPVEP